MNKIEIVLWFVVFSCFWGMFGCIADHVTGDTIGALSFSIVGASASIILLLIRREKVV